MSATNIDPNDINIEDAPSADAIRGFYEGMRPFLHPVLRSEDLSLDEPVGVQLLGRRLVLARLDGAVAALTDTCRHFQAQLSLGQVVEIDGRQCIQCPYHGWSYGNDGSCVRIPQLPEGREIPSAARVPAFKVKECYGLIWICLDDEPKYDAPEFPEFEDPSFRVVTLQEVEQTKTSSTRMIMGTLDDTHFPRVHKGILGEPTRPTPPDHKVWRAGQYLVLQYDIDQPPNLPTTDVTQLEDGDQNDLKIAYTDYVSMPNVIRLVKDGAAGRYVVWLATCPNTHNRTTNFWAFARNYDLDPAHDRNYEELAAKVRAQDKPIIESQRPWLIPPFWTGVELPLGPGDLPLMEYQKWLEELKIPTGV